MRRHSIQTVVLALLTLLLPIAQAQQPTASTSASAPVRPQAGTPTFYSFHPLSPLRLGATLDPSDLSQTKGCPFDYLIEDVDSGALTTSFDVSLVSSNEQLRRALGFDASIEASFLIGRVSASFAYNTESTYSSSSITVVVNATSELSRRQVRITKVRDEAVALLKDRQAFVARYGSRYVAAERRGARLSAILRFSNLTSTQTERLRSSFAGSGWGVSAKAALDSMFSSEKGERTLSIEAYATGGQGFGKLGSDLLNINNPASADALMASLALALQSFAPETGAPLGYYTQSLTDIGLPSASDLWDSHRADLQRQVASKYRLTDARLVAARAIVGKEDPRWQLLPFSYRQELGRVIPSLEAARGTLVGWYTDLRSQPELPAAFAQDIAEFVVPGDDNLISTVDKPLLELRACVFLMSHPGCNGNAGVTILDRLASEVVLQGNGEDQRKRLGAKLVYQMYDDPMPNPVNCEVIDCFVSRGQLLRRLELFEGVPPTGPSTWQDVTSNFKHADRTVVFLAGSDDGVNRWLTALRNVATAPKSDLTAEAAAPGKLLVVVASPTAPPTPSAFELLHFQHAAINLDQDISLNWIATDVLGVRSLPVGFTYKPRR